MTLSDWLIKFMTEHLEIDALQQSYFLNEN